VEPGFQPGGKKRRRRDDPNQTGAVLKFGHRGRAARCRPLRQTGSLPPQFSGRRLTMAATQANWSVSRKNVVQASAPAGSSGVSPSSPQRHRDGAFTRSRDGLRYINNGYAPAT
jgi:hypothetical protein